MLPTRSKLPHLTVLTAVSIVPLGGLFQLFFIPAILLDGRICWTLDSTYWRAVYLLASYLLRRYGVISPTAAWKTF